MTTTVTKTIGTGRDYSSFQAWADASPVDLTVSDNIWRGVVYPEGGGPDGEWQVTGDSTGFAVPAKCDDTRYFLLEPADGKSFADDSANPLKYDPSKGTAITVSGNYTWFIRGGASSSHVRLKRLQFSLGYRELGSTATGVFFERCLVRGLSNRPTHSALNAVSSVFISTSHGNPFIFGSAVQHSRTIGCTFVAVGSQTPDWFYSLDRYSLGNYIKNCAVFGVAGFADTASLTKIDQPNCTHNAASFSSFGFDATGNLVGLSAADQFRSVDPASLDLRVKAGSALVGKGEYIADDPVDIFGRARSTTSPSIGAEDSTPVKVINKVVRYTGGDYTSVADAAAAIPADLVAANEQWNILIDRSSASSYEWDVGGWGVQISSKTTDATRYIRFAANTGASFKDHADKLTAPLRYDATKGAALVGSNITFSLNSRFGVIEGLQFRRTNITPGGSEQGVMLRTDGDGGILRDCIIKSDSTSGGPPLMLSGGSVKAINVLVISSSDGIYGVFGPNIYSSTVVRLGAAGGFAISSEYAEAIVQNTAAFGFSTIGGSFKSGSSHNITDLAAPNNWGTGSLAGQSYSAQFNNITAGSEDFRTKSGSAMIDAGVRDQANTGDLDIVGKARSTTKPTVGAWENVVVSGGTKPTITTTTPPTGTVGTPYSWQLVATGDTPITWSSNSAWRMPAGLGISTSGLISGTPTGAGLDFGIVATNAAGTHEINVTITINPAAPTVTPPTVTTTTMPDGTTGVVYSKTLTATGDTPITWTQPSGSLPAGLQLSSAGVISGTPTNAGTATFSVRATNSAGSDDQALSMTVTAAAIAPTITTTTLPDGLAGTAYSQQINSTGTSPITYSAASGSLPSGMNLSQSGLLSGTPSVAGVASFTVRATNSVGSDDQAYNLSITAASVKPTITTSTLYKGKVGTAYATALTATGTAPITWTKVSGDIPPGLSLGSDGAISGTPTTDGSFTFVAKASNVAGDAQASFTMTIDAASTGSQPSIDVPYAQRPTTLDGCWSSWSEQQQQNLLRTQMDSGAIKVRRRTTGIARVAQVSVSLPAEKYATFMSWYNVNCQQGVLPTLMCTPQCNEELWRFVEPPQITWTTKEVFVASATIERLPGW